MVENGRGSTILTSETARQPESVHDVDQRLKVGEAAKAVQCSEDTIRRGYWSGHLKVERFGARLQGVRIRQSALDRWLADGARTA